MSVARLGVVALLALAACGKKAEDGPGAGAGDGGGGGGAPGLPVEVAVARQDTVVDAILATGEVEAIQSAELKPEIDGRITEILMREGTEVREGAPLFRIDDAELKAEVARATAERDLAEQALARTRSLLDQKAASTSDLERAEATARSARASLELLQVRLGRTTVRAPFSGILGQRMVSLGDYVTTGTSLVRIQTVDPQRVSFTVPERYAREVKTGQQVTFRVAALPGEEFQGRVDFVSPSVQLPARTLLIKALVPNGRRHLQPGMFTEMRLATAVRPRAIVVPEEAVFSVQGTQIVWAVVDGKANRRPVTIGVRSPGEAEITSGLNAGEQVVVGGQSMLAMMQDGAPVTAMPVEQGKTARGDTTAASAPARDSAH